MRLMIAVAAFGLLAAAPAIAQVAAPAAAPATAQQPPKKADGRKIVCKTDDFVGSLIPRRICKTRAEWEERAYQAKNALDRRRLPVSPVSIAGAHGG